jgi:ribose 5-phosphate isomerase B
MQEHWAVASDHAGRELKRAVAEHLLQLGHAVHDVGCDAGASVDYPDYAEKACRLLEDGTCQMAVLCCGTGLGMCMTASRFPNVRAALCTNEFMARMARSHNDANVLCLGERVVGMGSAHGILEAFLHTAFTAGRHQGRLDKLAKVRAKSP